MNYEKYALPIKVLEAGGSIESRCINPPLFTDRYVFTKEQLERFIEQIKQEHDYGQHHRSND
jgi:hypothetical protein